MRPGRITQFSFGEKCVTAPVHSQCLILMIFALLIVTYIAVSHSIKCFTFFPAAAFILVFWWGTRFVSVLHRSICPASLLCFVRYVCPAGSSSSHSPSNACPPGTVGNDFNLFDKSQCETCPAGFVCMRGMWLFDKVNCVFW